MFFGPPTGVSSTPEKTLNAFVAALNRRDRRAMEILVAGSKNNPALDLLLKDETDMPPGLSVRDVVVKKLSASQVRVQYLLSEKASGNKGSKPFREDLEMVKVGNGWLIKAPKYDARPEPGLLASFAMVLADPEVLKRANERAKEVSAASNLKQVATAAIVYFSEHEDKISLAPDSYVKTLEPYAKNTRIFTSPLDRPGTVSFLFNADVNGVNYTEMKSPRTTVLFFEGKPGALNFRYSGKALVAFCDGSVRFVTPAEAKTLLWK